MFLESHVFSSYLILNKPFIAHPEVICEPWQFQQRLTPVTAIHSLQICKAMMPTEIFSPCRA